MKINLLKEKVYKLLLNNGNLRNSDQKLIALIWFHECKNLNVMSAFDFLQKFSKGEFTNPESIRRTRQKIQEEIPALRGTNYKKRQENQTFIKKQLNYGKA